MWCASLFVVNSSTLEEIKLRTLLPLQRLKVDLTHDLGLKGMVWYSAYD